MTVTGWYYVIGVLIAGPFFGRDVFEFDYGSLPPLAVAEIVYVLVLGTTLPNYLLYYGTEKLTSVHTGLYAYLQPIAATALGLYRHQIELGYDNLVAAILIFVGIVLVIITYVKFRFPAPGAGKTSGGDRSEPVSVPGVSVPPPADGERGTERCSAGSFGTSRPVAGSIREEAEFRGERRDVCVVSDNRSMFRTENRQRLPEPCMRGAGGCPRPSAESLGGGRAERRRAVRVSVRRSAKTNRIRDDVEGKGDIDQRGKSGGSPDDRPGGRARFSCRRAERSSGVSARGAFARFGGIRRSVLSVERS